jgi:hypothetical protein
MYPSMRGKLRGGLPFHAIEERISRLDQLGSEWARARTRTNAKSCRPVIGGTNCIFEQGRRFEPELVQFRSLEAAGRLHLMERISGLRFRTRLLAEPEDEFTSAAQDRYLFARLA